MEISLNLNIESLISYSCRQIKLTQDWLSSSQQGKVTDKRTAGNDFNRYPVPTYVYCLSSNAIDNYNLKITVPTDFIVKKFNKCYVIGSQMLILLSWLPPRKNELSKPEIHIKHLEDKIYQTPFNCPHFGWTGPGSPNRWRWSPRRKWRGGMSLKVWELVYRASGIRIL